MAANSDEPVKPVAPEIGARRDPLFGDVDSICDSVLESIAVDGAAVAVLTGNPRVRDLIYATDKTAHRLDELQFILGEGPCLDAVVSRSPHLWADLDAVGVQDARWPAFAIEALELGARALFAFPIPAGSRPLGAIELYRRTSGALTAEETQRAATAAKKVGALVMGNWRRFESSVGSTEAALEAAVLAASDSDTGGDSNPFSRGAIHIATGFLAVQLNVSADEALDRIRAHCYADRRSPDAVANDIISRRLKLDDDAEKRA